MQTALARVPFSAPSLESRLENWGSWSRRQMVIYEQCESFEGCYRSKQPWDAVPANPPIKPEDRDAYDIALACASLMLRDHLALKLGYVFGLPDYRIAKVLTKETRQRVQQIDMMQIFSEAKANLVQALKAGATVRRLRTVERIRLVLPRVVDKMID